MKSQVILITSPDKWLIKNFKGLLLYLERKAVRSSRSRGAEKYLSLTDLTQLALVQIKNLKN